MSMTIPNPADHQQTNFTPIPPDNYPGVCIGVTDLGTHMESYQGGPLKPKHKMKFQFELPNYLRDDGQTGVISMTMTLSTHDNSAMKKTFDSWLGADWPARLAGKGWGELVGIPAMVNVENRPDQQDPSRVFAFVASLTKWPKGFPAPAMTRNPFVLMLDEKTLPEILSLRDAEKIRASLEYRAGGFSDLAPRPDGQKAQHQAPPARTTMNTPPSGVRNKPMTQAEVDADNDNGDGDQDIPF